MVESTVQPVTEFQFARTMAILFYCHPHPALAIGIVKAVAVQDETHIRFILDRRWPPEVLDVDALLAQSFGICGRDGKHGNPVFHRKTFQAAHYEIDPLVLSEAQSHQGWASEHPLFAWHARRTLSFYLQCVSDVLHGHGYLGV